MSLPVLLLLSFLTVQCDGCNFDREVVKNIKSTIDSNPTGFRTVFPRDYNVTHHYNSSMLCDTDPCCVFPAAAVLLDSWHVLLRNLWNEHLKHSFIVELIQTLDTILNKTENTQKFKEATDLSKFPSIISTPEKLLSQTSEVLSRWLEVGCSASIETCSIPTLAPTEVQREDNSSSRSKHLTTRAIKVEEGLKEKMMDLTQPPSNGGPLSLSFPASFWSPLLFRLYWWLLP
ncbi:uncharacterized protein LOC115373237 [Myripristis murdjan]|uniref:uncharacterized protein LOC115373237 n=1 Tax=Myripristis murdjan TaxID=586833 RepID=UPI0011763AC2|nr:uncharacterized protein LOC115373237 [Myripristis murdjan]